ncbi:N-acyl-D-amino-acid deacylase family protein [Haliangium sp.]|uniref:N-acyl-D-amino-acid deacylase family protein n=1 Tax=Haliangium sp. TaxID=2663208 RepID=UPI003D0D1E43
MSFDLKITGGRVIDGTGRPSVRADVAIKDGVIAEVGTVTDAAERVIDAEGAIVTPGFVDIHTHYDGQVSWDSDLAPSCYHGVTTAVMGNCGVGFAPVRERDHERLITLMEGVEDIPGTALSEGIQWGWESFADYLAVIGARPRTMDVCAQVPHDALRVYAMGERGADGSPATADDIAAMRRLCREALEAGAAGFSTGRTDTHRTAEGHATPAAEATANELAGIAEALVGLDHGVLQVVSDFDMDIDESRFDPEFDIVERMAQAAPGHWLSMTLLERDRAANQWRNILRRVERANAAGLHMRVQVAARPVGVILGLEATFHPFMGFPSYKAVSHLPLDQRVEAMRAPGFKERLLGESSEPVAGDGSPMPPLADQLLANIGFVSTRLFRLGVVPDYEPDPSASLFAEAQARGATPLEVIFEALLEQHGRQLLYLPLFNYTQYNLDHLYEMLTHPLALAGLSDGGAHVGTICDASFPTTLLTHWTRDRTRGPRLPIERVVEMLTRAPAAHIGLSDRGVIAVGCKADVNVIDMARLHLERPGLIRDLPAGGRRFIQRAVGYRATVVSGQVVLEDDRLTGHRPGGLVRLGRDAARRPVA